MVDAKRAELLDLASQRAERIRKELADLDIITRQIEHGTEMYRVQTLSRSMQDGVAILRAVSEGDNWTITVSGGSLELILRRMATTFKEKLGNVEYDFDVALRVFVSDVLPVPESIYSDVLQTLEKEGLYRRK